MLLWMFAAAPVISEEEKKKVVLLSYYQYLPKENLFSSLSVWLWCDYNWDELDSQKKTRNM